MWYSWILHFSLLLLAYADKNTDELDAKQFLETYNETAELYWNAYTEASWAYNTDINDENKQAMVRTLRDHLDIVQAWP